MSTAELLYAPRCYAGHNERTPSGSGLGRRVWLNQLHAFASRTGQPVAKQPLSFEERLQAALGQTEKAIRGRAAYFGNDLMKQLITRARVIYDPDGWQDGEAIPNAASAASLLRAIAAIKGEPSLGVSKGGSLTATWHEGERSLTVEGLSNGLYKWAYVIEREDDFVCHGHEESKLPEVLAALKG